MQIPETIWETELTGLNVWSAHNIAFPPKQDMTVTNLGDTGFLFEGTGFSGVMPAIVAFFNAGNRGILSGASTFTLEDPALSRTPTDVVPWAVTPSMDAREWWNAAPGQFVSSWPIDPLGHAMCTWRETSNGARVIGFPSHGFLQDHFNLPGYRRLFENVMGYLSTPSPPGPTPVPGLGILGRGVAAAATIEVARRALQVSSSDCKSSQGHPVETVSALPGDESEE